MFIWLDRLALRWLEWRGHWPIPLKESVMVRSYREGYEAVRRKNDALHAENGQLKREIVRLDDLVTGDK